MDVAVIGAAGTIGRQVAISLVADGVLPPTARLQLLGRRGGASERLLPGFAADLIDAYAERAPVIDLACDPDELVADVVVCCAGATVPADPDAQVDRRSLARVNVPLVAAYAEALARHGHGEELLLVVSNPVEAGVAAACRFLPRRRVIGMGAHLDSLRFRYEIAHELGVRRQAVQGLVLGEHGAGMVPCWSTVSVYGMDDAAGRARIAALRSPAPVDVAALIKAVRVPLRAGDTAAAYALVENQDAALRTLLRPLVTQLCGARTPVGSAAMIGYAIARLVAGEPVRTGAQVALAGELGLEGVTGVPVIITQRGVEHIGEVDLAADELAALAQAAEASRALMAELP